MKMLVVDDSAADADYLRGILSQAGHQVITVSSGAEAVDITQREKPDAVFMDVIMENVDGFRATRELAENAETHDIPVVLVTSKNQRADRVWGKLQGAKGYISKPYRPEDVQEQLQNLFP
jgi:twitching motility two-component system response regulator PilH